MALYGGYLALSLFGVEFRGKLLLLYPVLAYGDFLSLVHNSLMIP